MNERRIDRRVARTRALLRQALLELIIEQGYDRTTVQHILERANVGRSTFYAHFKGKDDLLYGRTPGSFLLFGSEYDPGELVPSLRGFFEHMEEQQALLRALIGADGSPRAQARISARTYRSWRQHLQGVERRDGTLPLPLDILAKFLSGAMMAVITWWLDAGCPYPAAELSDTFRRLAVSGLGSREWTDDGRNSR